jgi:glycerophosphoryl diester phosphodiesterase
VKRFRTLALMFFAASFALASAIAQGIGPSMTRIIDSDGNWVEDNFLVREAQARGLVVHPYTMRADRLPGYVESFDELLELFLFEAGVDGVFTDHTDLAVEFLRQRERRRRTAGLLRPRRASSILAAAQDGCPCATTAPGA